MKAVQIAVGGVAVLALLAGAYRAGQGQAELPMVDGANTANAAPMASGGTGALEMNAVAAAGATEPAAPARKPPADTRVTEPAAPRPAAKAPAPVSEAPRLCAECATVVDVRSEQREGKASGIGAVGGALLGGLLGHQVGGGTGKKLATVAGAAAGGFAGNQVEKSHGARQIWMVRVSYPDGGTRSFEFDHQPDFRVNTVVRVHNGTLERY